MATSEAANVKKPGKQWGKYSYEPSQRQPGSHILCKKCGLVLVAVSQVTRTYGYCTDCRDERHGRRDAKEIGGGLALAPVQA